MNIIKKYRRLIKLEKDHMKIVDDLVEANTVERSYQREKWNKKIAELEAEIKRLNKLLGK